MNLSTSTPTVSPVARILLVDDHPLVRRGFGELISARSDMEVCGEAADADAAMEQIEATQPDLVVVDISLADINGIELIKRIRGKDDGIKILVASMHDESIYAERALRAGATGYVNKEVATDKVIEAILQVLSGQVYLSSTMTDDLLHRVVTGATGETSPVDMLSDRELEVFEKIGRGMTTREIAEMLKLSVKTIETHREHIKIKMRLRNAAELTRAAVQWVLENDRT
ncbi:response regulator [Lignipirellula cremea]|uniref:Oxygen regulatory protein NreC n=1 Tax=Lignipirellula cremea TaxID=2528010 RepID=A0A518DMW9_9BACT|nr:response regulator transcription factor [Lignipirellula cremea]QDU93185.1 Oxygen regulatory protein NreC [Lignipirellula cremea]